MEDYSSKHADAIYLTLKTEGRKMSAEELKRFLDINMEEIISGLAELYSLKKVERSHTYYVHGKEPKGTLYESLD